jgi:hypothetical protein
MGEMNDLFGPPYGRNHNGCIEDSWTMYTIAAAIKENLLFA